MSNMAPYLLNSRFQTTWQKMHPPKIFKFLKIISTFEDKIIQLMNQKEETQDGAECLIDKNNNKCKNSKNSEKTGKQQQR